MFPHTAWTEGAERAARYRHEADTHRVLRSAGYLPWSRAAASRSLRRAASFLSRFADRLAGPASRPAHEAPHPFRSPAARPLDRAAGLKGSAMNEVERIEAMRAAGTISDAEAERLIRVLRELGAAPAAGSEASAPPAGEATAAPGRDGGAGPRGRRRHP